MLKRVSGLIMIFLISLSLVNVANSYTSAKINANASLRIVSSENALIAIPSNLTLVNNSIETTIKNNMSQSILVKADNAEISSLNKKVNPDLGIQVRPGEELSVTIVLQHSHAGNTITFHATQVDKSVNAVIVSTINKGK